MSIDSRKSKLGYLVAGLVIGAISFAMAPAIGHVGDKVGHLWEDHLFDKAKADFFTKAQTNKRFFTKTQANQRFVNIGEAADVAHDIDCSSCIQANQIEPEDGWTEVTSFATNSGGTPRFANAGDGYATAAHMEDRWGVVHLKGTVEVVADPTNLGTVIFTLPYQSNQGNRVFLVPKNSGVGMSTILINNGGQVIIYPGTGQIGDMYSLDGISYRP